jgi:hypothetical protein
VADSVFRPLDAGEGSLSLSSKRTRFPLRKLGAAARLFAEPTVRCSRAALL